MKLKDNIKLFWNDIRFKNGVGNFIFAFVAFLILISLCYGMVAFSLAGQTSFVSICAGLGLGIYIISSFGQNRRIDELEQTIREDKQTIKKLLSKSKVVDLDKLNQQMKELQNLED